MLPIAELGNLTALTPQQHEELFAEVIRLYDLADNVMAAVSKEGIANRDVQLELAKPFVTKVIGSANILAAFYTDVIRSNRPITPELQDTLDTAFRTIFIAIKDFYDAAEDKLLPREAK